jgi:hypothetical protein
MAASRIVGLVLIAIGLGLLAVILTDVGGEVFLGAVGLGFLIAYAASRTYGLLIPGAILTGLALGVAATSLGAPDGAGVLGLGVGFLAIVLADRRWGTPRPGWWWPLIPGGILSTIGVAELVGVRDLPAYAVPVALIVVGAVLLFRRTGRGPRQDLPPSESTTEHERLDA